MAMPLVRPRFTRLIAPTLSRRANASAKWLFRTPCVSANSAAIFVQGFCCKVCVDHNQWCRDVPIEPHFVAAGDFATPLPLHIRMPSVGGSGSGSGLGCGICCSTKAMSVSRFFLANAATRRASAGFCWRSMANTAESSTMAHAARNAPVTTFASFSSSAAVPCQVAASFLRARLLATKAP